jgi:hypothetical protein
MNPPVNITLHKAPASIGRSRNGKTLWSVDQSGPWIEVEAAAKEYLERRGWQVEYNITFIVQRVIDAAFFTIFTDEKNSPHSGSLISSGQSVNRVDGIAGHAYDAKDKDAFAAVQEIFRGRGIHLEGPLQFIKIVTFSSKEYTNMTANTRDLFFASISEYLDESIIDAFRTLFEKWITLYTRKLRKTDAKKGLRFGQPIDRDYVLLRLESFIRSGKPVDFIGFGESFNAARLRAKLNEYKRESRSHHARYNLGRNISKPVQIPMIDEEILESKGFRDRYGYSLSAANIDDNTIAKWRSVIANVGMERILGIALGDNEKWSKTQTWFGAGDSDLFISKGGVSYFCEVKSPNDNIQQSQKDFMAYVPQRCGIEYIICGVKTS